MFERALMIINPRAGKMNFRTSFYSVVKMLSDAGCRVEPYFTRGVGDAAQIVEKQGEQYDLILVCGGDGTLNECTCGLMKCQIKPKIGYIPCGSTNDFANSLGIVGKPLDIVKQIIDGQFQQLDLGSFNERNFTYTASFGAFASTSYDTSQNLKNAVGHLAYILSGAKQLANIKPIQVKVTAGDFVEEGQYIYGGVSNTTSIGGVYTIPEEEVSLCDGQFELMMVRKPANPAGYINTLLNIAARNYDDPNLIFMHTDHVIFETPEPLAFSLDGEYGGSVTRAEIKCLTGAYQINGKSEWI